MLFSEDKINHLAHRILRELTAWKEVRLLEEEEKILREIKKAIIAEVKIDEEIDTVVRERLLSYSRKIPEGSPEWDILYQKLFSEEMRKKGREKR